MILHPSMNRISKYLDGILSDEKKNRFETHISKCEACNKKVQLLDSVSRFCRLPKDEVESVSQDVMGEIKDRKWHASSPLIGEIQSVVGVVIIKRNSEEEGIEAFPGLFLRKGDYLITIGDSKALVQLPDRSHLYVNKESKLGFTAGQYNLSMRAGEIFAMMKRQKKLFEIETPSAVLGVIGTDFDAQITKKNETILKVLKGKVSLKNESGSTVVKKKHQVEAAKNAKPIPRKIQDTRTVYNWTIPVKRKETEGGWIMKRIIIGFVAVLVLIGALAGGHLLYKKYFGYEPHSYTALTSDSDNAPALPPNKGRIVYFPEDRSLGKLMVRDKSDHPSRFSDWEALGKAQQAVRIPSDKYLRLDISRNAAQNLSPLAQLKPDDLYFVSLWHTGAGDDALKHLSGLTGLQILDLRFTRITDNGLKYLKPLTSLKDLNLGYTQITDKGLANIGGMTSLESLSLVGTKITDAGLAHLTKLRSLKSILLAQTKITGAGLAHLKDLDSLESLELSETYISDKGLAHLSNLTNLEWLSLRDTKITDAGLAYLKPLQSLKFLRLDGAQIGDAGMAHIKELKSLEMLYLPYNSLTDKGMAHLGELPALKVLHIGLQKWITDTGLAHLSKIKSLQELNIGGARITDTGMDHLAKLTGLEDLWLQGCPVTNEGLAKLKTLKSLKRLLLNSTKITGAGLAHLKAFPSLTRLELSSNFELGEARLKYLADLTGLEWLELNGSIQDDDLVHLSNLKRLKTLYIDSRMVTDRGFAHLAGLTALEHLNAYGCKLTDAALAYLTNMKNLEYIQITGDFTDAGLHYLEKLPSLRYLRLPGDNFSPKALEEFSKKMPSLQNLEAYKGR